MNNPRIKTIPVESSRSIRKSRIGKVAAECPRRQPKICLLTQASTQDCNGVTAAIRRFVSQRKSVLHQCLISP
ncbi:MAG: hypothetical protein DWH97_00340 [Planctomycetota bacterium]|nr:MAG: hypothetical protein DWH97_00340 [Planctomycetota bacterium]